MIYVHALNSLAGTKCLKFEVVQELFLDTVQFCHESHSPHLSVYISESWWGTLKQDIQTLIPFYPLFPFWIMGELVSVSSGHCVRGKTMCRL